MSKDEASSLTLRSTGPDRDLVIRPKALVIAGYTGADRAAVEAHIAELALLGVPPPASVPVFFRLDPALITTAAEIQLASHSTSGEVEPVLIRSGEDFYLGVGSDHTDRELEGKDLLAAKKACPKALGPVVTPLSGWAQDQQWRRARVSCWSDGRLYQSGSLAQLLTPLRIWDMLTEHVGEITGDVVAFLGTLPLLVPKFHFGSRWEVELALPGGPVLRHAYDVITGRTP